MIGPVVAIVVLAGLGALMLAREARRFLRDETRYASNPREARLSSLSACAIALVLLAAAGGLIWIAAALGRYQAFPADGVVTLQADLEPAGGGARLIVKDPLGGPRPGVIIPDGWYSVTARSITWRGPLRWIGFPRALRHADVLTARQRADLAVSERIRRVALADDGPFERFLQGPARSVGLWSLDEVRTPWRPVKAGPIDLFFSESGGAVTVPRVEG